MIDVEQRALRPLEQDVGSSLHRAMDHEPDIFGDQKNPRREPLEHCNRRIDFRSLLHAERREKRVRMRDAFFYECSQTLRMSQIENAHPAPRNLVFIRGPNSTSGCSDLSARGAQRIDQLVKGKNEM